MTTEKVDHSAEEERLLGDHAAPPEYNSPKEPESGKVAAEGECCGCFGWTIFFAILLALIGAGVLLAFWINTPDPFPMVHPGPDELFCKTCDCRQTPPRFDHSWRFQRQDVASILHDSILDIQCQHVYAAQAVASAMVAHSVKSPNESFAWDVAGLQRGLPTSFIFTKTSPAGKTGAERPGYMQRHIDAMRASRWSVNARGHWFDGVPAKARQSVWIVVEDGLTLDPGITATLDASDLNWVYLGYGPTHSYGNAQHNAALALIHTLASRVVKDGPILGIDDDAEIHPDLLQLIWKVKKAGIWPIGNLGPNGWEGPEVDAAGRIVGWSASNTFRTYPIDNNAFTFHSSLLGSNLLPGPAYWPTDLNGGESEFMETILSSPNELEVLCSSCHVAWHNHPLGVPHVEDLTYDAGSKPWESTLYDRAAFHHLHTHCTLTFGPVAVSSRWTTISDAMNAETLPTNEEDRGLLSEQSSKHYLSAASQSQLRGILLIVALPCLLFLFVPLSRIFHSDHVGETATEPDKPLYFNAGQDPYFETHPDAHGAAWAAEHGSWAAQGTAMAGTGQAYEPVGKLRSNGTHDFERTVLMISLDGVRADYLTRDLTPHLLSMSERGLRAEHMQSAFPSLTFPNHWTMMTGLYPESHGIVANDFFDPTTGKEFTYTVPERSWPAEWWHGEPIWSTVQKIKMRSAVLMWPGPPKMLNGIQPTYWRPFMDKTEWSVKADQVFKWLDLPLAKRPNLIAAYLPEVDQEGHHSGPVSEGVNKYLAYVDAFINEVYEELQRRNLHDIVDILVVSDHGMTSTDNERVIYLDRILGEDGYQAIEHKEGWPSCGLRFKPGTDEPEMLRRLQKGAAESNGGFSVFTHETMPQQWHFSGNPRIAPIYVVPEVGWVVSSQEEHLDTMKGDYHPYGNHGYDPAHPDMHAIAVFHGPFASHLRNQPSQQAQIQTEAIPSFHNVELYGLVMRLLDIPESMWAPNNGTAVFDAYVKWDEI